MLRLYELDQITRNEARHIRVLPVPIQGTQVQISEHRRGSMHGGFTRGDI